MLPEDGRNENIYWAIGISKDKCIRGEPSPHSSYVGHLLFEQSDLLPAVPVSRLLAAGYLYALRVSA